MHPIKHFAVITRHRHMVIAHCIKAGIPWRGLMHDLSKYSPTEFFRGARYFVGTRSPNEIERAEYGYSLSWMHHKGRNRHHFEYWVDYDPKTKLSGPVKMPLKYVIEMFCDRMAASKIYNPATYNDHLPLDYFLSGKGRRVIHPETSELLESLLTLVATDGEEAAFRRCRELLKVGKY